MDAIWFVNTAALLRIPSGKRIWFWYETAALAAPADASELKNLKQFKFLHIVKAGLLHIFLDWLNFNFHQWYGFKFKNLKV